jgi:hypothetical protein
MAGNDGIRELCKGAKQDSRRSTRLYTARTSNYTRRHGGSVADGGSCLAQAAKSPSCPLGRAHAVRFQSLTQHREESSQTTGTGPRTASRRGLLLTVQGHRVRSWLRRCTRYGSNRNERRWISGPRAASCAVKTRPPPDPERLQRYASICLQQSHARQERPWMGSPNAVPGKLFTR